MKDSAIPAIALAAPLAGTWACGDDDDPAQPATNFSATLSGAEEVPAVPTTASGTATLSISGSTINYTVNVTGLENPVVSHIHIAPPGEKRSRAAEPLRDRPSAARLCDWRRRARDGTNGLTVGTPAITFDSLVSALRARQRVRQRAYR